MSSSGSNTSLHSPTEQLVFAISEESESDADGDGDTFRFKRSQTATTKRKVELKEAADNSGFAAVQELRLEKQENYTYESGSNRSIEIFFGKLTNFGNIYQSLSDNGYRTPGAGEVPEPELDKNSVDPCAVKKLCLLGHPINSFKGLNSFRNLSEAWVTNCCIKELRWCDFQGLEVLQRLYLFAGSLHSIEPLHFDNLKVLWLAGNQLVSLSFLSHGLINLMELNVANNQITSLAAEELFKCSSLKSVNIAGNPICSIQDVLSINVLPNLKQLHLIDPVYGRCPITSLCESRAILVHKLCGKLELNGKEIEDKEKELVQEYVAQRCLYYFASAISSHPAHTALRHATVQSIHLQLEALGERIIYLSTVAAKCLQADYQMQSLPAMIKTKKRLLEEVAKIHTRLSGLKQWSRVIMRRIEAMLLISRWEEAMEQWIKWVEYKSYGVIIAYITHSSLDLESRNDPENILATIHQMISSLSCIKPWPENCILSVETIITLKDRGAEAGMERIHEGILAKRYKPKFIPPPPDVAEKNMLNMTPDHSDPAYPFYGPPCLPPPKVISTYLESEFKAVEPVFTFPDSVFGLPEQAQPSLMFLICEKSSGDLDPIAYLHSVLFEKSRSYKDVRLTNCFWIATDMASPHKNNKNNKPTFSTYSIVCVVKVLSDCLIHVSSAKSVDKNHGKDCEIYTVDRPLAFAPVYLIYISHTMNEKTSIWFQGIVGDADVLEPAEATLAQLEFRLFECVGHPKIKTPYYLHRTHDGVKADLTAVTKIVGSTHRTLETEQGSKLFTKSLSGVDLLSVAKFLGPQIAYTITSLDLCGNRLGLTVGLEGLLNLRKLNVSHNNLTTLSGLHRLPHLKELKAGWNFLRFLHSNITTLAWACSKLVVLELLPNPFQDVRDFAHIPLLAQQMLTNLTRVDAWTAPFSPPVYQTVSEKLNVDGNLTHEVMKTSWVGLNTFKINFKGRCLYSLECLPYHPPFPKGSLATAMELDASDNYITSANMLISPIVKNADWRTVLVRLQLQENAITNLDWMADRLYPNLRILNLAHNSLSELEILQFSCPNLQHLHISGNPLPCSLTTMAFLRGLTQLLTLDASRTLMANHPDYAGYILRHVGTVQVLDGIPMIDWNTEDSIYKFGGNLSPDWIDRHVGRKDWNILTEIALPNCGLQNVQFPAKCLPKLLKLDLSGNGLTTVSGLNTLLNLRVLSLSHNHIESLGIDGTEACPECDSGTIRIPKGARRNSSNTSVQLGKNMERIGSVKGLAPIPISPSMINVGTDNNRGRPNRSFQGDNSARGSMSHSPPRSTKNTNRGAGPPKNKPIFPKLEILVLSHNGLTGIQDLHLHALPSLRTVILNCNKIKTVDGLSNIRNLKTIVLDNNNIINVPFNCLSGCKTLKYLHLEHNKIASLPRLPHLKALAGLYLGYNRIQSLTDISVLNVMELSELNLIGNPASFRNDYSRSIFNELPALHILDGADLPKSLILVKENGMSFLKSPTEERVGIAGGSGVIPDGGLRVVPLNVQAQYTDDEESKDE